MHCTNSEILELMNAGQFGRARALVVQVQRTLTRVAHDNGKWKTAGKKNQGGTAQELQIINKHDQAMMTLERGIAGKDDDNSDGNGTEEGKKAAAKKKTKND